MKRLVNGLICLPDWCGPASLKRPFIHLRQNVPLSVKQVNKRGQVSRQGLSNLPDQLHRQRIGSSLANVEGVQREGWLPNDIGL